MTSHPKERYNVRFVPVVEAEARLVKRSRESLFWFIWYVSGMKPPKHLEEWCDLAREFDRLNIVSPRESAKTTWAVYALAFQIGNHPMSTNMVLSVSAIQAQDRLNMIREIIEHNPRWKNVFPHVSLDLKRTSNKTEFTVVDTSYETYGAYRSAVLSKGDPKNPTLVALGIGSAGIIGRRVSGIMLVDDIHSEQNSATKELRDKIEAWINRTVLPLLKAGAKAIVINTRWAPDDYSGRLLENSAWRSVEISAYLSEGSSYWPEVWPVERLVAKMQEVGLASFRGSYLNDVNAYSSGAWTIDILRYELPDPLPDYQSIVISTDLAVTDKTKSDYCAFGLIARTRGARYDFHVLDIVRDKLTFRTALDELTRLFYVWSSEFNINAILFEDQALTISSYQEAKALELPTAIHLVKIGGQNKELRLNSLYLKASRGGMCFNTKASAYDAATSEILGFPRAPHDDLVDVLTLPVKYWGIGEQSAGIVTRPNPVTTTMPADMLGRASTPLDLQLPRIIL